MKGFAVRQQGLTFIELSLTLVVLGIIAALLAALLPAIKRLASSEAAVYEVSTANEAITGFAFATGRLPCADTNGDGYENCPAAQGGYPYLTLGQDRPLRNIDDYDYRYAVYTRPSQSAMNTVELNRQQDRWQPTLASGLPPATALTVLGNNSHLDLCRALAVGQSNAVDRDDLHVEYTTAREHIAYLLVDPGSADLDGDGSAFDGLNASGRGFEHPTRSTDSRYDDRVSVVYFNELWAQMSCAGLLSTAGHAHPNTVSTLAMLRQSLRDYKKQLQITKEMTEADILQQAATVASAAAGLASASAAIPIATASAINTAGVTSGGVALAATAVALNGAAVTASGFVMAQVVDADNQVGDQLTTLDQLISGLDTLHTSVNINMRASDRDALSDQ